MCKQPLALVLSWFDSTRTSSCIITVTIQQQPLIYSVAKSSGWVNAHSWLVREVGRGLSGLHDGSFSPITHGANCQLTSCHHTLGTTQCCSLLLRAALSPQLTHVTAFNMLTAFYGSITLREWFKTFKSLYNYSNQLVASARLKRNIHTNCSKKAVAV